MAIFLSIAALFALALLATSKRAYRIRRSPLGVSAVAGGWLAIGVGAILGPEISGLITPDAVLRVTPLLSVGLGWIGLMVGLQARRDVLSRLPSVVWRLSLVDAALSVIAISSIIALIANTRESDIASQFIAGALLVSASIGWSMETRSVRIESFTTGQQRAVLLRASGGLSALIAISAFGIASAIAPVEQATPSLGDSQSLLARLGALGAASFVAVVLALVAKEGLRLAGKKRAEMLVVFLGVVGLAAGISADLGISPLFPSMLCGAVFANLRTAGPTDSATDTALFGRFILQAEHVVAAMFSLLAGILLDFRLTAVGLLLVGSIIAFRVIAKPIVYRLCDRDASADREAVRAARIASIRQSPVAVAIGVSLFVLAPSADAQRLLTLVVLIGFACEVIAALGVRRRTAPTEERP